MIFFFFAPGIPWNTKSRPGDLNEARDRPEITNISEEESEIKTQTELSFYPTQFNGSDEWARLSICYTPGNTVPNLRGCPVQG